MNSTKTSITVEMDAAKTLSKRVFKKQPKEQET